MYKYNPESLKSLYHLAEWERYGAEAEYQRQTADLLWVIACEKKANSEVVRPFSEHLDNIYASPFKAVKTVETGQEIIDHLLQR